LNPIKYREGPFILASIVDTSARRKTEMEAEKHRQQITHLTRVDMLSHFSGSLAHELNQPLAAIMTNTQVAKRLLGQPQLDLPELKTIMDDIMSDSRRASDILVRLRSWLKKDEQSFSTNNINALIEEAVQFLRAELLFNRANCSLELTASLPPLKCDKVQIQQVVVNLVKNGIEGKGGGTHNGRNITIRTASIAGDRVVVSVHNDGEKISEAMMRELFHPFMSTKAEGLGIGLSICNGIIQNHGGRIWVENGKINGVTFHFELPALREALV